ncbi:MAG: tetratricopeptide repeat protein [Cyanobacteriota bacterium]|nr:tetratricopeptide repeat protein [Cyanobacteriota bacterium]
MDIGRQYLSYLAAIAITLSPLGSVWRTSALAQTRPNADSDLEITDSKTKADQLFQTGLEQFRTGLFEAALETYKQVLAIRRELDDKAGIAQTLNNMGDVYSDRAQYSQALDVLQQALALNRELGDSVGTSETLNLIGFVYRRQKKYSEALELHEEALQQAETAGDRRFVGESLHNLGAVYTSQGQFDRALNFYERAMAIREEVGDSRDIGRTLNNMGAVYFNQGNYDRALEIYQEALAIRKEIGDRAGVARLLNNIAFLYRQKGDNSQALKFFEEAISTLENIADNQSLGRIYNVIAELYREQTQPAKALEAYEKAFQAALKAEDRTGQISALDYLADAYYRGGDLVKAKDAYERALAIYQELEDRPAEGKILSGLGKVYALLGDEEKAREFLLEALSINREDTDPTVLASTLNNLGVVYNSLGEYSIALNYYKQALNQLQNLDDEAAVAVAYKGMGDGLYQLRQYPQALENYELAWGSFKELEDSQSLGNLYTNMAEVLESLEKKNLAIAFHKQALNLRQEIANPIDESQKEENTKINRSLAGLLLEENRLAEAQEVLESIKIQEIEGYLGTVRGNNENAVASVRLLPVEAQIFEGDTTKNLFNLELEENDLKATNSEAFNNFQEKLQRLPGSVVLYPLILEDRLELVLFTAKGTAVRKSVEVTEEELKRAIANFRLVVASRVGDAEGPAEELYNWLIKPIENELRDEGAETIIYLSDRQLRYIPLGALYDGDRWLVERFNINNIAAASLSEFDAKSKASPRVLAAGLTAGDYNFQIGDREVSLIATTGELVANLAELIPGTNILLDEEFTPEGMVNNLSDRNILHLDTPVALVTGEEGNGKPEDSFILFANGERLTLQDMAKWSLPNLDLVVLSAAETNLGGDMGNGEEIVTLGYQMQQAGVGAIITSLWRVDEEAAGEFLTTFYSVLQEGKSTAEALRETQITMISKDGRLGRSPYYWAQFVLMGNGF